MNNTNILKINIFKSLKIKDIEWIDWVYLPDNNSKNNSKKDIKKFLEQFNFHELDIEGCLEENQNPRIDYYDDYVFITLHFPKYNKNTKRYYFNEMNFFLSKNRIISLRKHDENLIDSLFEKYKNKNNFNLNTDSDEDFKITSAYILYEILQELIEKMFKSLDTFSVNLRMFEVKVFKSPSDSLVKEIMIKKRNIVSLKHMIKPAINVLKMIELRLKNIFDDDLEVYFEDLEDKIQKAFWDSERLLETIESIEDSLKTLVSIKTSHSMRVLTLLSTFLLPLTFITSFYWMNISLPFEKNHFLVYWILLLVWIFMFVFILNLRKRV